MTLSARRRTAFASFLVVTVSQAGAGELRGRFLVGDQPAPGVTVSAIPYEAPLDLARREARRLPPPKPLASVTTSSDGSFALAVPAAPGKETFFAVQTDGGGSAAARVAGLWDATETADLGDYVLSPGGTLAGRITDATGAPVGDAEVALLPQADRAGSPEIEPALRAARTGADGAFRVDGGSSVGNTLTVEKTGLAVARRTGVRSGLLGAPIALSGGATVAGSVRKVDGRSPAAGTVVRLEGRVETRWVETGADGAFTIPDCPAGTFTLVADAGEAGYAEQTGVRIPLAKGTTLSLALRPPSAMVGRTVDAKNGRPVPRTKVEAVSGGRSRSTRSGPDGSYALRGLAPGSWRLRADEQQFVPWTRANVPLRSGETKKLDVPLVLGASLSGRVIDEDGHPVANARGSLAAMGRINVQRVVQRVVGGQSPAFRTRADGTFRAARLAPSGSVLLTVSHLLFQQATVGGIALAGGTTKAGVTIVLKRGVTLTGVVRDADGRPVAGAEVTLAQPLAFGGVGGRGRGAVLLGIAGGAVPDRKGETTSGDGTFAIHGVASGEYVLTARRSGYATERVDPVKVPKSGSPAPLVVTLTSGATISGRIVRRSGAGVEGFAVRATSPGFPRFEAAAATDQPTGPDGMFSLDGLNPGQSYDLQTFGSWGMGEGKHGVVAPASDVVLTVAGPGRIAGKAVDAGDGHPITEFQVSYEPDRGGGFRAVARAGARAVAGGAGSGAGQPVSVRNDDGTFALEDVPAGTWSVVVTAAGYQPGRTAGVEAAEGETNSGVEVRVSAGTTVKGRVVDATSGVSVANASISIASAGGAPGRGPMQADTTGAEATTDADGTFEIDGVSTGKQPLHATHPDYADATQIVQVGAEGATVEVRMTPGGSLAGTVHSDTGQPVPGANVALVQAGGGGFGFEGGAGAQSNVTDTAGQFRFDHLGAGRYSVTASLGSHTSAPAEVVLQAGQPQPDILLQLQVGVTIQGTVSGLPATMVTGMTVGANGPDSYTQSMRLGADGSFEFDNVPLGVVTVRGTATDPSGSTRSTTKQVTTSADQPVLTVELVFDQGFTLSGRVTQAGQPLGGAMVFANLQGGGGRQASATTDDGGSYQLNGLQEGTYTVNAMSPQAGASRRQTVTMDSDQSLDIAFPSAKITGQVVDAEGNAPLANASLTVGPQDPNGAGVVGQRPTTTDTSGRFSFTGLDEATYTLSTSRADYQVDTRDATAAEQGDPLVIALKRAAGIGVKVQDGLSGVPLPAVMVRVFDPQGSPVFGPSAIALDSTGQGEIPSLAPGTYTVLAGASGYAPVRLDGVAVPSATVSMFLTPGGTILVQAGPKTLAQGTASGTVTSASGQPALLSLFNLEGRIAVSEPNLQLRNVPPGSYVVLLPAVEVSQTFAVGEGGVTTVQLP